MWTQEPQLDGYVVQWKAPGEDYHSSRQIVLSGLSSLSTTISGLINVTQYTIRIAAVDTSDPGNFLHKNGHKRYVETTGQPSA